jgi:D-alanyl-D-alanine carboxypeptidase
MRIPSVALSGFVAAAMALLPVAAPGPAAAARPGAAHPDQELTQLLDRLIVAGAPGAAARVTDGHGVRAAGRGVADVRTNRPMRPDLNVRVGSVTKPMVATVVLQLVGEGRLSLDDTVEDWLPGILPYGAQVTVRQLLTMTSGVPEYLTGRILGPLYASPPNRFRSWAPRELVAIAAGQPLTFPPGGGFHYSNTNYVLAGLIVEAVTGRSLGHELTRRVFGPLRMRDTSFPVNRPTLARPSARGYSLPIDPEQGPVEGGALVDITVYNPSFTWAAGNVVSSLEDVTRFLSALLTGRLLSLELLAEMTTWVDTGQPEVGYGTGLQVIRTPCGDVIGHDGGIPGFATMALATADGRRHFALVVNQFFPSGALSQAFSEAVVALMVRLFPGCDAAPSTSATGRLVGTHEADWNSLRSPS